MCLMAGRSRECTDCCGCLVLIKASGYAWLHLGWCILWVSGIPQESTCQP